MILNEPMVKTCKHAQKSALNKNYLLNLYEYISYGILQYMYLCMYTGVCILVYVYLCMYTCVCIRVYVYLCMYTCI